MPYRATNNELAERLDRAADVLRTNGHSILAGCVNEAATRLSALTGASGREVDGAHALLSEAAGSLEEAASNLEMRRTEEGECFIERQRGEAYTDLAEKIRAALATLPTAPTAEEMRERCAAVADAYADIARQQGLDDTLIRLAAAVVRSTPTEDTTP